MRFLRILVVCAVVAVCCLGSDFAEQLFKAGARAEKAGDILHAYLLYARASALDPANVAYAQRKALLRTVATMSAHEELGPDPADMSDQPVSFESPTGRDKLDLMEALPPPRLAPSAEKKSFDLRGDAQSIFERVAEAYGLLVVFEADYQSPPPFRFRLDDATFGDALRALETVSNSFVVPVNSRLALVARDTPQKRAERSPMMSLAIPIPQRFSVQDAQDMINGVRQTMDIRRIVLDPQNRLVIMRDQVAKVEAARRIFATLTRLRPQVEVEVEFLEVDKNSTINYGLSLPSQFPLVNFGHFLNNNPFIPNGFTSFLTFGGGATLIGIGITQAQLFFNVAKSTATSLLDSQIVSLDGQAATLHVGQRYPIITSGYFGTTTGSGTVFAPPPTINFEDLGLVLKITPSVHADNDVTLDVESEFKVLGNQSAIAGIPIILNRKFAGKVRLKTGEWAVLAGLVQNTEMESQTGIWGVSRIPLLGKLLSQNTKTKDYSNVLLILKPHLVTLPPWEEVTRPIWVGTESRPVSPY